MHSAGRAPTSCALNLQTAFKLLCPFDKSIIYALSRSHKYKIYISDPLLLLEHFLFVGCDQAFDPDIWKNYILILTLGSSMNYA